MQGWGENSLLLARVVKQGSRLPGEAAELSQKNTGQQLSGTAQVRLISPKGRKTDRLISWDVIQLWSFGATQHSMGFTRQSRHRSKRGDETLGAWLAVIPAQGRKLSTFSCLQQCPFYAGKSHKKMESVTEMPKMFTLDKRLPRFSGCERWRCLRLSLNRQVSLPVKNIL